MFPVVGCLVCDTDSPRGTAGEGLSSSPFILSLSTFVLSMFTQDGQLEAVKLNLEDSKVCVENQRKIMEKQLSDAALVNNEEHMRDHHDRLKVMSNRAWAKKQSNDTKRRNLPNDWGEQECTLSKFWSGTRFTRRR